ncbi:MAG TPA: cytochrome c [Methylomirabilota bacterium]|nr:cytochrome c [Methylomirabilota bacterium]
MRLSNPWKVAIAAVALLAATVVVIYWAPRESRSPVVSGEHLYQRYCAPCHGREGRGDGPLAGSLEPKPSDLTRLRARLGGSYSLDRVAEVIDGRRGLRVHSATPMPAWGEAFEESLRDSPYARGMTLLQLQDLAEYLDTLQSATR